MTEKRPDQSNGLRSPTLPGSAHARSARDPRRVLAPDSTRSRSSKSLLTRWGPAWFLILVALGSTLVLILQHVQISQLSQTVKTLLPIAQAEAASSEANLLSEAGPSKPPTLTEAEEIRQLQGKIDKLKTENAEMNSVRAENDRIRAQLAAPAPRSDASAGETAAQAARERAMKIACINNLKQLGLAVRIWAGDHNDVLPPDVLSMSNELSTPKILVCPADGRQPAADWASFGPASCSYDYLAPSANESEPTRVLFRCPIHGNYGLCDGSVQSLSADAAASALVQRDGKLYLEFKQP